MCTIVPDFQLPLLSGDCLTLNSELHQANFKRSKREAPACFWLFQGCGPIKVRLLSLMVEDEEHKIVGQAQCHLGDPLGGEGRPGMGLGLGQSWAGPRNINSFPPRIPSLFGASQGS
nr:uncharacterized protein LOC123288173 isoform X2 [Equus asinus]